MDPATVFCPIVRRGRMLARKVLTLEHAMFLVGTVYNFCTMHEAYGCPQLREGPPWTAHRLWLRLSLSTDGMCMNCCRFISPRHTLGTPKQRAADRERFWP
jgi:hypothetical protein